MSVGEDTELWRDIPGFPGYQVSDQGRVRSRIGQGRYHPDTPRPWRTLKQYRMPSGYRRVCLCRDRKVTGRYVHHLVLETFVGPRPDSAECRHVLNPDRGDNRLKNLAWGTHLENIRDMHRHGTTARGSRKPNSRLTEGAVAQMRRLYAAGLSLAELSRQFFQSRENVFKIVRRRTWRHVP